MPEPLDRSVLPDAGQMAAGLVSSQSRLLEASWPVEIQPGGAGSEPKGQDRTKKHRADQTW